VALNALVTPLTAKKTITVSSRMTQAARMIIDRVTNLEGAEKSLSEAIIMGNQSVEPWRSINSMDGTPSTVS